MFGERPHDAGGTVRGPGRAHPVAWVWVLLAAGAGFAAVVVGLVLATPALRK
jgi:hypothetical protein